MLTINDKEYHGFWANLLGFFVAIFVLICTFSWLALAFLAVVAILTFPIWFPIWLIMVLH